MARSADFAWLSESVGYVFGILLASFMLDACFPRHVD